MRGYAKVLPQFWIGHTGKQIKDLGIEEQLLALYLMTSPHATMIGIYYLPISFITHETGLSLKSAGKAMKALSDIGFCTYDKVQEYVWVHEMALYQISKKLKPADKRVIGVNNCYQSLPNLKFLPTFFEKYKNIFWLQSARDQEDPSQFLSSQEQEQKQDQEQEIQITSLREVVVSDADNHSSVNRKLNCPHEEIVNLYHKILFMCPPVRAWNKKRQQHLRQRWNENPKHQTLEWWERFFEYVKKSRFLMGESNGRPDRPPFKANLEWLILPSNFVKVIEGNYHK